MNPIVEARSQRLTEGKISCPRCKGLGHYPKQQNCVYCSGKGYIHADPVSQAIMQEAETS